MIEAFRFYKRTTIHKLDVAIPMIAFALCLIWRAIVHDLSKYRWREAKWFIKTNARMRVTPGGTDEYFALVREIQPGIDEHYLANSHHPEHHLGGITNMSALDEIEMVFDWAASSKRAPEGDVIKWIVESGKKRPLFNHGPERMDFYIKIVNWMVKRRLYGRG